MLEEELNCKTERQYIAWLSQVAEKNVRTLILLWKNNRQIVKRKSVDISLFSVVIPLLVRSTKLKTGFFYLYIFIARIHEALRAIKS